MPVTLNFAGATITIDILARQPQLRCRVGAATYEVSAGGGKDSAWLIVNGRQYPVWRVCEGDRVHLKIGARTFSVEIIDELDTTRHGPGSDEIRADMPGVIVTLRCQVGDLVSAGDPLLTLESMKMQITLHSPRDGRVAAVPIAVNQPFQKGAVLVALAPVTETTA